MEVLFEKYVRLISGDGRMAVRCASLAWLVCRYVCGEYVFVSDRRISVFCVRVIFFLKVVFFV